MEGWKDGSDRSDDLDLYDRMLKGFRHIHIRFKLPKIMG